MLRVPVWKGNPWYERKISCLSIPLFYRMWKKEEESKLVLAKNMICQIMPVLEKMQRVIILCDSWYAKKDFVRIVDEYENLDIICNARYDSVLYDLAPKKTGKKGGPAKRGQRLHPDTDFTLCEEKIDGYHIGFHHVLTNLFGSRKVIAYVTASQMNSGTRHLFFSTISSWQIHIPCAFHKTAPLNQTSSRWMPYIPLFLYSFRWNIEVSYYEQKNLLVSLQLYGSQLQRN